MFIHRCMGKGEEVNKTLTVLDLKESEQLIMKIFQEKHFYREIDALKLKGKLVKTSQLSRLDPYLDDVGMLRVGGRLQRSSTQFEIKHPIILPKREIIAQRLIEWHHHNVQHIGRTGTYELRNRGYWLIHGNAQVKSVIFKCVLCKLFRGQPTPQKMSDLPGKRLTDEPPFSYCRIDMFGPFLTKEGRTEMKRYGLIFTCFSCRAIHLEMTNNLDTDSFILGLRRFIGRRGPVRSITSDNGGNFIGAEGEFKRGVREMDHNKISDFLVSQDCVWIQWGKNPPISSHMGGVWERQIRSVRSVLSSFLKTHAGRLNDECLQTLFVEVEAIVNSRPLTVDSLNDESAEPLTPNHILTMKTKVVLPPPGVFQKADILQEEVACGPAPGIDGGKNTSPACRYVQSGLERTKVL